MTPIKQADLKPGVELVAFHKFVKYTCTILGGGRGYSVTRGSVDPTHLGNVDTLSAAKMLVIGGTDTRVREARAMRFWNVEREPSTRAVRREKRAQRAERKSKRASVEQVIIRGWRAWSMGSYRVNGLRPQLRALNAVRHDVRSRRKPEWTTTQQIASCYSFGDTLAEKRRVCETHLSALAVGTDLSSMGRGHHCGFHTVNSARLLPSYATTRTKTYVVGTVIVSGVVVETEKGYVHTRGTIERLWVVPSETTGATSWHETLAEGLARKFGVPCSVATIRDLYNVSDAMQPPTSVEG